MKLTQKAGNALAALLVLIALAIILIIGSKAGFFKAAPKAEAIDPRAQIAADIKAEQDAFAIAEREKKIAETKADAAQAKKEEAQATAKRLRAEDAVIVIESTPVDFTQPQPENTGALQQ